MVSGAPFFAQNHKHFRSPPPLVCLPAIVALEDILAADDRMSCHSYFDGMAARKRRIVPASMGAVPLQRDALAVVALVLPLTM